MTARDLVQKILLNVGSMDSEIELRFQCESAVTELRIKDIVKISDTDSVIKFVRDGEVWIY